MDGDQGAINKFLNGEWSAGAHDIETSLGNVFSNDLIPALKAFIQQFASDFGSKALAQAAPLAAQVIAGSLTIQQAGTQLVAQVGTDAVQAGEDAGQVALNALRVNLTSQAAASASPPAPQEAAPAPAPDATTE